MQLDKMMAYEENAKKKSFVMEKHVTMSIAHYYHSCPHNYKASHNWLHLLSRYFVFQTAVIISEQFVVQEE